MELSDLGLNSDLNESARKLCGLDLCLARVTAVDRSRYVVRNERGEVPAELTGKLAYSS